MTVLRQFYRQSVVRECPVRYNGATNRTAGSQGGQNDVRTEQDRFWEFSGTAAQGEGHDPERSLPPACMFRIKPSANGSAEFPIVKDTTPNITNSRLNNIP